MDLSDGCLRCYSQQDLAALSGDVDAVPDDLVIAIATEVYDHWSRDQWQYLIRRFAPRLIALVRAKKVDPGLALRTFGSTYYADLASWPEDERRATEEALDVLLVDTLEQENPDQLVEVLGGLASISDDLGPWLARIDAAAGPAAEGGRVRLACHWATELLWGEDRWFSWWYPDDPVTPVREWTLRAKPEIERFSQAHPECKTAKDALIAFGRLERDEDSPWVYPGYAWGFWERWGQPGRYGWLTPTNGQCRVGR